MVVVRGFYGPEDGVVRREEEVRQESQVGSIIQQLIKSVCIGEKHAFHIRLTSMQAQLRSIVISVHRG